MLLQWHMEELNAILEEYEARKRLLRGARWALVILTPFWVIVVLALFCL